MTFSSLAVNDCFIIHRLFADNFSDGWSEDMLKDGFIKGNLSAIGCFIEDKLVGVATFNASMDGTDLTDIVVDKSFRKKGIGERLVFLVCNASKESGINKIFLEVRESNSPAIKLYKKCGFKQISVRKKYYSDGENALIFVKEF